MRQTFTLLLACLSVASAGSAQTSRERAVAIDRIEVPVAEDFTIEAIGPALNRPWSLAFLSNGVMLVTERHGGLRLIESDGHATPPIDGAPPDVLRMADSGLLDVVLDPDFASNRLIYVAFVEGSEAANRTAIWKARFDGTKLADGRVIFRSNAAKKGPSHPGGRMLFLRDGTLLLTIGDGYDFKEAAQDPASHLGKVLRLTAEGGVPPDNPFVGRTGHAPEVWTLGHRNIQGLMLDSATNEVWSHDHGPRGGDEINLLEPGKNYGWPRALWGIDYDGKRISDQSHVDGMEDPKFFWAPSIAPSGLAAYHGTKFPQWQDKLLVGALAARGMVVLRRGKDSGLLVEEQRLMTSLKARIRDVRVNQEGDVYLLTDDERGRIWRLAPAKSAPALAADHHLAPVVFLTGNWTGESRFRPIAHGGQREIAETSTTECRLLHKANHLRCLSRLTRSDGRTRVVEHTFNRGPEDGALHAAVISDGWPSYSIDRYRRDPQTGSFEAEKPYETGGKNYIERVTLSPAADGKSLVLVEAARPAEGGEWFETFRWNLRKQD